MSELWIRDDGAQSNERVTSSNPLPVKEIAKKIVPTSSQTGLSIAASSTALTVPAEAVKAVVTVFGAPIRFWVDGRVPTATTGHRANTYDDIVLSSWAEIKQFRAVREGSVSATLEITYYQEA